MCSNPVLVLLACWYKWMGSLHSTEKSSRFWQICQKNMHHLKLELRIWVNIAYPLSSLTHDSTKANGRLKPKMVSHILGLELEMNWYGPILLCNRLSKPLQSRFMSYLCYMCLLAHSGVQHICCQFRWIVHFWLPIRYSLTFICYNPIRS
jgi:hypothetical protein